MRRIASVDGDAVRDEEGDGPERPAVSNGWQTTAPHPVRKVTRIRQPTEDNIVACVPNHEYAVPEVEIPRTDPHYGEVEVEVVRYEKIVQGRACQHDSTKGRPTQPALL